MDDPESPTTSAQPICPTETTAELSTVSLNYRQSPTAYSSSGSHLICHFVITWRAGCLKPLTLGLGVSWQALGENDLWDSSSLFYLPTCCGLNIVCSLQSVCWHNCHCRGARRQTLKGVVSRGWGLLEWILALLGLEQLPQELVVTKESVFVSGWLSLALSAMSWGSKR